MIHRLREHVFFTRHRRAIDGLLEAQRPYFRHDVVVLDVGGRERGRFRRPVSEVKRWIVLDVEEARQPDIVADVSEMTTIGTETVDVIVATELFEHVAEPERGLAQCNRVLRDGGVLILSAPFLYRVHGDPVDFQRWTAAKWRCELERAGFAIETECVTGRFFSSLADHVRALAQALPGGMRHIGYALVVALDAVAFLDGRERVKEHPILGTFHSGYFFVARK